jgi:hypothetical protein
MATASSYSYLHLVMSTTYFHVVESMSDNMNSIITVSDLFAASIAGESVSHKLLDADVIQKLNRRIFQ